MWIIWAEIFEDGTPTGYVKVHQEGTGVPYGRWRQEGRMRRRSSAVTRANFVVGENTHRKLVWWEQLSACEELENLKDLRFLYGKSWRRDEK